MWKLWIVAFLCQSYLPTHGNMASDANVDGESRFKRTGASAVVLFTHIVRFEIEYSRKTTLWRFMHQQNLKVQRKNKQMQFKPSEILRAFEWSSLN